MKSIFLAILALFCFSSFATTKRGNVVYGEDDRKDVFESTSALHVKLSKSTAGMIPNSSVQFFELGKVKITGPTLLQRGVCAKEKFSNQITSARCSGFLIGKDTLATAGHCMTTQSDCNENSWVFDYAITQKNQKDIVIPSSSVYKCKQIIKSVQDPSTMEDYAIVKLDREVTEREPLKFRTSGKPSVGDKLVVIGCPTGLPLKISDNAKVRKLENVYFSANLDTYGGNSGSAVFNSETGIVEGILVRGERDYIRDTTGCMISNVCPDDGCRGEDVSYSFYLNQEKKLKR